MVVTIALSAKYIWVVVTHDWSALEVRTWHEKKTNIASGWWVNLVGRRYYLDGVT